MLKRKFIIKKQKDFQEVFKKGRNVNFKFFTLKILKTERGNSRIGISIGTKIDKRAVYRNKFRRQIKAIFKLYKNSEKSLDLWVLGRKGFNQNSLSELKESLEKIL